MGFILYLFVLMCLYNSSVLSLPVNIVIRTNVESVAKSTSDSNQNNLQVVDPKSPDVKDVEENLISEAIVNQKIYSDENEMAQQSEDGNIKHRGKRSLIVSHMCPEQQYFLPPPVNLCVTKEEYNEHFNKDDYKDY